MNDFEVKAKNHASGSLLYYFTFENIFFKKVNYSVGYLEMFVPTDETQPSFKGYTLILVCCFILLLNHSALVMSVG